jgi:hypothetical protein
VNESRENNLTGVLSMHVTIEQVVALLADQDAGVRKSLLKALEVHLEPCGGDRGLIAILVALQ